MWSFEAAAAWYKVNGKNQTLKSLLDKGFSPFLEKMLKKEVPDELIERMPVLQEIVVEAKSQIKNLPAEVIALEKEWEKILC